MPIVANVNGEFYPDGPRRRGRRCSTCSRGRSPLPCSSSRGCARCTTPARASSSRSARRRRCRDSPRTCSATTTTCSRSSPTIRSSATSSAFNQALCGLYAAGLGAGATRQPSDRAGAVLPTPALRPAHAASTRAPRPRRRPPRRRMATATSSSAACSPTFLERGRAALRAARPRADRAVAEPVVDHRRRAGPARHRAHLRRRQRRPHPARRAVHRRRSRRASAARCSTSTSRAW